ncbi:MAG: hypothetical protein JWO38_3548 [Gemmataceae bacterium]|nr:hypothetical protein [Gemmataceae bacterium]
MLIRGLPLPPELVALIEAGRWACPADPSGLDRLFPRRQEFCCYSYAGMASESGVFERHRTPMWHGTPDPANPPGDIDPSRAVLIADLGLGYDQPIALDYRTSLTEPVVLTLSWDKPAPPVPWKYVGQWKEGKRKYDRVTTERLREWVDTTEAGGWNRWELIAPDFARFAAVIGLTLCDVPRDVFADPSRPAAIDPAWLTTTVVSLACEIYADRAFDRLPILADALQDAGCEDQQLLGHCRGPGPHVRGCWVVDLLLGKEQARAEPAAAPDPAPKAGPGR